MITVWSILSFSDRLKTNSSIDGRKDASKDGGSDHIAAHTFTFRELAAATKNFRADCLLGEGGFGRVYKGRLESTNQVCHFYRIDCYHMQNEIMASEWLLHAPIRICLGIRQN